MGRGLRVTSVKKAERWYFYRITFWFFFFKINLFWNSLIVQLLRSPTKKVLMRVVTVRPLKSPAYVTNKKRAETFHVATCCAAIVGSKGEKVSYREKPPLRSREIYEVWTSGRALIIHRQPPVTKLAHARVWLLFLGGRGDSEVTPYVTRPHSILRFVELWITCFGVSGGACALWFDELVCGSWGGEKSAENWRLLTSGQINRNNWR